MGRGVMGREAGFTLIEALIAIAIVALVVTLCLMIRTGALADATEARNWRVAREVAQEILSELRAGARESPPEYNMQRSSIPKMKDVEGWQYQIVIGEEQISAVEGDLDNAAESSSGDYESSMSERRAWQKERDDLRKARQAGVSFIDYRETARIEEEERLKSEQAPSEDEFEQVAVFVFFPDVRGDGEQSHFALKARVSTLALEGLTPEEAEALDQGGTASTESEGSER